MRIILIILVIHDDHGDRLWTVYRRESRLPEELLNHELRRTPEFEVAVAVPEEITSREKNRLCVYFPTNEVLPLSLLCHASLDTDDSRNRLVKHAANKYVLKTLGEFVVDIAVKETTSNRPFRGLELLTGIEKCDPELNELGLRDAIIEACKASKLFYRADGSFETANEVRRPPHSVWFDITTTDHFPEILRLPHETNTRTFLDALELPWYDDQTITDRLEQFIITLQPQKAGKIVGMLMTNKQIPRKPLPSLLIGESGKPLSSNQTAFTPAETESIKLPSWVTNFSFLDRKFTEAVRRETAVQTGRDLRYQFVNLGYRVEEFQLESVGRHLVNEAAIRSNEAPGNELSVHKDVLQCIYKMAREQRDLESPIKTPLNIITTNGTVRKAANCYLGPDYPGGSLVFDLYKPLEKDEFVGAPSVLGLDGDIANIENFLLRIGVARNPKIILQNDEDVKEARLYGFIDLLIDRMEFPNRHFGGEISSADDLKKNYRGFTVIDISLPDRFTHVLEHTDPVFIIKYLATVGGYIFTELDAGAVFHAKTGNERKVWPYRNVPVPNFALHLLKSCDWIPCDDGQKRKPNQIILSRTGSKALRGTFFNYTIDLNHPSLKEIGGRIGVESILLRLGATYSLESLKPDDLYSMLLKLPESDPQGRVAPAIYRAIIGGGIDTDSYLKEKFIKEGCMWGKQGRTEKYFPIKDLKYLSQAVAPKAVLKEIPLVDINPHQNASEIRRIFDVPQLRREDVSILLDPETTQYQFWSSEAWRHVKRALPFLYAFRLSKTVDETGKERRLFRQTELNVCSKVGAKISLFGEKETDVVIEGDTEGLVIGNSMFLVSHNIEFSIGDQVFLRAIGNLFSDLWGLNISSDFAGFLGCDTEQQMHKLLEMEVGGKADELLNKAKVALQGDDDDRVGETVIVPPPHRKQEETSATAEPNDQEKDADKELAGDTLPERPGFKPVAPPVRAAGTKKRLVVTGRVESPRSHSKKTVMVDEAISLEVAVSFEENADPPRYVIPVEYIKGFKSLGCDIVSVSSEEIRKRVEDGQKLNLDDVIRFIEVKGRSNRTGIIELTENQLAAAETFKSRYFLYRVFRDPVNPSHFELAILSNPADSEAKKVIRTTQFDFSGGSGAEWFQVTEQTEEQIGTS